MFFHKFQLRRAQREEIEIKKKPGGRQSNAWSMVISGVKGFYINLTMCDMWLFSHMAKLDVLHIIFNNKNI
jgi:hypothetical protein